MKPAKSPSVITPTVPASVKNGEISASPDTPQPTEILPMPHERDQDVNMTPVEISPVVEQAAKDIKRGLKDTSNAPEMDATYHRLKGKKKT